MRSIRTKTIALTGMMLALAIALSYLESLLPSVAFPGVKLGLSNTVTMYCLFFLGPVPAFLVALLKAGFVLVTRGAIAGLLSLSGGLCSVGIMLLITKLGGSFGLASVAGAITHNLAQLAAVRLIIGSVYAWYYLPVLVISGIVMGVATALVLRVLLPVLDKITPKKDDRPPAKDS